MVYLLHISDLHLVADPQWNNMKNAILYSVREKLGSVPRGQKLLIISGDFHNFEQKNYIQARQFLPQLFEAMDIEPEKDVFVIPGNHDVLDAVDAGTGEDDRDVYIQAVKTKPDMIHSKIEKFLSYYDSYLKFVQEIHVYPPDCGRLPIGVHVRTWRDKLHLLHLNTTLIADGGAKKNQMLDILTATGDDIRRQLRTGNLPCFAIGHNSFFDLESSQQKALSAMFLQENVSAYLCGDRHKRNLERAENRIVLSKRISSDSIPNIVGYRGSVDEGDTYSDFGMIWHNWDEHTGRVVLEFMKWDPEDQGELQPDGPEESYFMRKRLAKPVAGLPELGALSSRSSEEDCWLRNKDLLEKGEYSARDIHVQNFLKGSPCTWSLAFSDRIVTRGMVNELCIKAREGGVYALVGPGGEGKSTILKQMCVKLIQDGEPVFYYRRSKRLELPERIPEGAIFVLDNPPDSSEFKLFLDMTIENGQTLILGARQNEWNLLKSSWNISAREVADIPLPTLSEKEADCFAGCVWNNLKCRRSREEIKEVFQNNSYGFLYAAMLMVVNNKNSLEDIAQKIIRNLRERSPKALHLLAHIVLAEHYKVKFTNRQFRDVCNELEFPPKEATWALSREISLNGQVYQTRHDTISELFYQELFSESGLLLQQETDEILVYLMEWQLKNYNEYGGKRKMEAWNSVMKFSGGLVEVSLDAQKYLIDRILDEFKTRMKDAFEQLFSCMADDEVRLLFCRKCFEREHNFRDLILKWCRLLLESEAVWDVLEPYSPAWIMREACVNRNASSGIWQEWARLETQENGAGSYEKENTARWIYEEAFKRNKLNRDAWLAWAQLEAEENNIGDYENRKTARWIYREACVERDGASDTWQSWAQLEAEQNNIGDYESENTARWIYREACIGRNANSNIWQGWAQMETEQNNIGDYERENTARWIYKKACIEYVSVGDTWRSWAKLEIEQGNIGDYEKENTARWIYRKGCVECNGVGNAWESWAKLEAEQGNIGDYEKENTAKWIYREACIKRNVSGDTWRLWAQFETGQNNIGDYDKENTARWICWQACIEYDIDGEIWNFWAQLEAEQGNVGDYESKGTARWIYREACINRNIQGGIWLAWAQLETEQGNIRDYEKENTARWIYREACINRNIRGGMWRAWAQFETEQGNIGDYREENTARWICREACMNRTDNNDVWPLWGQLEKDQNNIGDVISMYTTRWIYKEVCVNRNIRSGVWRLWALLEIEQNNIGDYESENTASWIYNEGLKRFPDYGGLYTEYASMELRYHSVQAARDTLRRVLQNNSFSMGSLAVLEFFSGNIDSDDPFCMVGLIERMKEQNSYGAFWYLYHCFLLLGKKEDAERYYKRLLRNDDYKPSITYVEDFIQTCRELIPKGKEKRGF